MSQWLAGKGRQRTADAGIGEACDQGPLIAEQPAVLRVVVELAFTQRDQPLTQPIG